jgi:TonB family protein
MFNQHRKSEMERRRVLDISTIGVLFCLIIGFYFIEQRNPDQRPQKLPADDTTKFRVIVIPPTIPEKKASLKRIIQKTNTVVKAEPLIKPDIKKIEIRPNEVIIASLIPTMPVIEEDTTIYLPIFLQKKPKIIYQVEPAYPALALLAKRQGLVILRVIIGKSGTIERIGVLKSEPLFDQAAVEALEKFKFAPAYQNDQPVRVELSIPFRFEIK